MAPMNPVSYEDYPLDAFARDFDAVTEASGGAGAGENAGVVPEAHAYIQRTYADPGERTRRGVVLAMCLSFIANHLADRAFRRHVIRGVRGSLFSEPMFRAIYEVVGGFALNLTKEPPSIRAVLRRANQLSPKRPFSLKRLLGLPRYG
jgi:hypothetical protein